MQRGSPYSREHAQSEERKWHKVAMPKTLSGLIRWYESACTDEIPTAIHGAAIWHDSVTAHEAGNGVKPLGGSLIGSLAYSGAFRAYIEGSPSQTDDDGYYVRPLQRALGEMTRQGRPVMARCLFSVAQGGFEWRAYGRRCGWLDEMWDVYLLTALRFLWTLYREADERRMRIA